MRKRVRGFTLIELVIAMAIVALLAAIALPSYRKQMQKSNRAVAKTVLTQVISRQEAFFADRKVYSTTMAGLNYGVDGADKVYVGKDGSLAAATSTDAIYSVNFSASSATAFTVQALPLNTQSDDTCGTLTITSLGVKSQSGSLGALCWKS
jgi:type IV pilus assembly protein PilE